jgi:hypothetical protein
METHTSYSEYGKKGHPPCENYFPEKYQFNSQTFGAMPVLANQEIIDKMVHMKYPVKLIQANFRNALLITEIEGKSYIIMLLQGIGRVGRRNCSGYVTRGENLKISKHTLKPLIKGPENAVELFFYCCCKNWKFHEEHVFRANEFVIAPLTQDRFVFSG